MLGFRSLGVEDFGFRGLGFGVSGLQVYVGV